ncbi:MAG: methyltransferase domain-containing protein [Alphaproteobacteria bacterium]|nr:MAG: methyltransferase domain-containing protein [Alphaproteobacteria bacterium]
MKQLAVAFLGLFAGLTMSACSSEPTNKEVLLEKLASTDRAEADRARDEGRKPADVLEFFGVTPGMTVLDLMAAGGYYTEVLSLAVGPEGHVYAQNPEFVLKFNNGANALQLDERLANNRLPNAERLDSEFTDLGVENDSLDFVITALNFHDVHQYDLGVEALVDGVYRALKPGGVFGVIDHAGEPGKDNPSMHRLEKQIAIDAMEAGGFEYVGESDVLANPEDTHDKMVFDSSIRGHTDRFVLKFRKP